jgi:ribosomal protein S18 acetylase RimI-like enzyme
MSTNLPPTSALNLGSSSNYPVDQIEILGASNSNSWTESRKSPSISRASSASTAPRVANPAAQQLREISSYSYRLDAPASDMRSTSDSSRDTPQPGTTSVAPKPKHAALGKLSGLTNALRQKIDARRYRTESEHFIANLAVVHEQAPELYEKTLRKIGRHLHSDFQNRGGEYASAAKARRATERRLVSPVDYETTWVAYRVKTNVDTGQPSIGFVGTVSNRQHQDAPMPYFGEGCTSDLVVAPKFRRRGHGRRLALVAAAEIDRHLDRPPELVNKTRRYALKSERELHEAAGGSIVNKDVVTTVVTKNSRMTPVDVFEFSTKNAALRLGKLGVARVTDQAADPA